MKDILKYYEERDGEVDVRVLIHQSLAGCVIGKGGSKIKEIRDKVGCRVLKVFPSTAPQSSDRVVQVIGRLEQTVDAVKEVLLLTKDTPIRGPVNSYDPINYDDMYAVDYGGYGVPSQNGGYRDRDRYDRGRSGDRYNDRRRDRSRSRGRDRDFISPWANDGPMSGGGFGGFGSGGGNNSGGFGGFGPGGGGFGGGNGPNFGSGGGGNFGSGGGFGNNGPSFGSGGGGGFGGGSGFGGGQGSGFGGGNMGMGNGNSNLGGMGGANSGGGGFGSSGNNMNGGNSGGGGGDGKNSTQVTIPKDLAGAIIGKNGQRIRRIRNESNAYITIDEPLPGSNDRIITISGTPKQIQMAQYLLQQSVLDSRK
ncbi:heterogeneous nuclear ribonucleoprotein K isoform X2 [Condylostylus longicornis]|nr:heterogeneous nuclear ribonucleoprotein K isoform X2 [Condylostylus longicornis]